MSVDARFMRRAVEGLSPTIRFTTTSFELVRAHVARGLGYSVLSRRTRIESSYEGRSFVTRPPSGAYGGLDADIVQLADARPTLHAEEFVRQCHRSLATAANQQHGP